MQGQKVPRKMLPKAQRRAYVGFDDGSKVIKFYYAQTRKILLTRNYHFITPSEPSPCEDIAVDPDEFQRELAPPSEGGSNRGIRSDGSDMNSNKRSADVDIDPREPKRVAREEGTPDEPRKTRGKRVDYKYLNDPFPDKVEVGIVSIAKEDAFAVIPDDDCRSLQDARSSYEWPDWDRAIQAELEQLRDKQTWKLVDKPPNVNVIANKWVFAKKREKDGRIIKYKARLVAKGCAQRPGYDFIETHSPVVRLETIRAILAIAPTHKLYMHQLDVKGAYLNGTLKERVYMRQPEGYDDGSE